MGRSVFRQGWVTPGRGLPGSPFLALPSPLPHGTGAPVGGQQPQGEGLSEGHGGQAHLAVGCPEPGLLWRPLALQGRLGLASASRMGPQAGLGVAPSTRASPALQAPWVWPLWLHFLSFISAAATRLRHPCSTPHSGGCPRGPLRPSRPWGRGGGTGTRGNMRTGLELSFCFPLGAPRVPLHPPPQAPDLPPQAPQAALPALVPGVPTACSSFPAAWRPPSPGSQGAAPLLSTGLSSLLSFLSFPQVQGSATPQLRGSSPCPAYLAYCCWPQLWPGGWAG